ncbi:MAG TPA: hypothetical protein VFQ53_02620 [Kofleriaceae bacterium]|nr:hypothetical protein [Kofleriaceae bacterium]
MSLALIGNGASYEFRWRTWALLRDVVVAHLDEETLPAFCSLGDAMVNNHMHVDAAQLAEDVQQIRAWLVDKPFDLLVLGSRTSSLLHFTAAPPTRRQLTRKEIEDIRPIADSKDLAEYFATMLDSMERVAQHPADDGTLELVDG